MEELEVLLEKIRALRMDLSAEMQNPLGHHETRTVTRARMKDGGKVPSYHRDGYDPSDVIIEEEEVEEFVVPKGEQKFVPDSKRRADAKAELQKICDSSEWYSARCHAGFGLGYGDRMREIIGSWIPELRELLNGDNQTRARTFIDITELACVINLPYEVIPDLVNILESTSWRENGDSISKKEARALLEKEYKHSHQWRAELLGKALHYSRSRVWAHNHPVTVTLAAGSAAIISWYVIDNYLIKTL